MTEWHRRFAKYYEEVLRAHSQSSGRTLTRTDRLLDRHLACDLAILGLGLELSLEQDTFVVPLEAPGAEDLEVESDDLDDEELEPLSGEELQLALTDEPEDLSDPHRGERVLAVRAGRKIQRTQTRDPYNRETTLGGPIVSVRRGDQRLSGPLLYWEVELDYNPGLKRLTVSKRSPVPELNVMLLEGFLEERGDIEDLTEKLQTVVQSNAPSLALVRELLRVVGGLVDGWEHPEVLEEPEGPLRAWLRAVEHSPAVAFRSVLFNTPRSNAALLQDLRKIARLGGVPSGSPLDILTNPDDPQRDPSPRKSPFSFSDTADGENPLWFPFESNPSQRRVGHMADRARILTVQGPPGTGKSQTIANLVSHLVAEGKSVLVTSHQRKAVEVVTELLDPDLSHLALSLIKGDRESAQKLQARIQRFLEDHTLSVEEAESEVQRGEEALHELDRNLRILAHRFQELSRKEHEQWQQFRPYSELRKWDHIHPEDDPPSEQGRRIERALPEWCRLHIDLGDALEDLRSLICPHGRDTTGAVEARIVRDLQDLRELGFGLATAPTEEDVRVARAVFDSTAGSGGSGHRMVQEFLNWARSDGREFVNAAERMEFEFESQAELRLWADAGRRAPSETLEKLRDRTMRIVSQMDPSEEPLGELPAVASSDVAENLAHAAEALRRSAGGFLSWHLRPSVRRARNAIGSFLEMQLRRERWESIASRIERAVEWYRLEEQLLKLWEELRFHAPESCPSFHVPERGFAHRLSWQALARKVASATALLTIAPRVPGSALRTLVRRLNLETGSFLDRTTLGQVERIVSAVAEEYRRGRWLRDFEENTPLPQPWLDRLSPLVGDLDQGSISEEGDRVLQWLEQRTPDFQKMLRMRELERGELASLRRTLSDLSDELKHEDEVPEWVANHVNDALKAHRLGRLLRHSLDADPDDIRSVARELRKGEERRRQILFELVRRRHRMHQARALQQGNVNAALQRVRKLLDRSSRMKKSLVALRKSIDFETVLKAFPAWICTIDDAVRLFPPKSQLFDYVIVDEASQCAQPALLPLALRCRHLVVVGDDKQLRPSFGRFIPSAQLDSLRAAHGLDEHRAGLFAKGEDSLLHFANYRANASGFLDEHFRCDPAIIAWSNERYYDNRLKVLTHRRPRSFTPALTVLRLEDADDDRERKQNLEEAKAVVREVRRLTEKQENENLSIGVISPFRRQADLIQELLHEEFERDPETLERHRIISSTADGFQGDERDIILYSFRVGPSSHPNTFPPLERQEERFNVAFSRAKRLCISFLSCSPSRLPGGGVTRSWIDHSQSVMNGEFHSGGSDRLDRFDSRFDSRFEEQVCTRLRDRGLRVVTQEPCGPYRIDLVVSDPKGRTLAVECDGEWKRDELGHLREEDYQRQDLIERAGWVVHRISGRRYLLDPVREIDRVVEALERQTTAEDRAILAGDAAIEDVPDGPDEAPPDAEPEVEEDGGRPEVVEDGDLREDERERLRKLIRWSLQGSKVNSTMFDRLVEIDERLKNGGRLTDADRKALGYIRRLAESQGFDPDEDVIL